MNRVILTGRLASDPDVRYFNTKDGKQLCSATYAIAWQESTNKEAMYFNCTCLGNTAEFASKFLKKGVKIGIEGRLNMNNYTDKDGRKHYQTQIFVEKHEFLESKKNASNSGDNASGVTSFDNGANNGNMGANFASQSDSGFMSIPENANDDALPFQ